MRRTVSELNKKGFTIYRGSADKINSHLVQRVGKAMYMLYDIGAQASPSEFDSEMFISFMLQEYPDEFRLFYSALSGSSCFTDDMFQYVSDKLGEEHRDFLDIMEWYHDILRYRRFTGVCNYLHSVSKMPLVNESRNIKSKFVWNVWIRETSRADFNGSEVWEMLKPEGYEIKKYCISRSIWRKAAEYIGVSADAISFCEKSAKPLFISGFTLEQECQYITLLIEGIIKGDTQYGLKLFSSIQKYYNDFYSQNTTMYVCREYSGNILADCLREHGDEAYHVYEECMKRGEIPVFLTDTWLVAAVPSRCRVGFEVPKEIGVYGYLHGGSGLDGFTIRMTGYTGEYIQDKDVPGGRPCLIGLPVGGLFARRSGSKLFNWHPIYGVRMIDGSDVTLCPYIRGDVSITFVTMDDMLKVIGAPSLDKAEWYFYGKSCRRIGVKMSDNVVFCHLVARLCRAYLCAESALVDAGCSTPWDLRVSDLSLNGLTQDEYSKACSVAYQVLTASGYQV